MHNLDEERGRSPPNGTALPAIVRDPQDPALAALADRVRREAAEDIACDPPAVILIDNHRGFAPMPAGFDTLGFFLRSPDFAAVFRLYRPSSHTDSFSAYALTSLPPKRSKSHCRR